MLVELLEEHAWSQYNLHRFDQAVSAAERAERLHRELDDRAAHVRSLCTLSRMQYLHNQPRAALASADRAVARAEELGELEPLTEARVARSSLHVLLDRKSQARPEAARALEDALLEFPGCAVVISHDRWFLDRIATHILAFEGNSEVVWFEGNYQEYVEDFKRRKGEEAAQPHRIRYKPLTR